MGAVASRCLGAEGQSKPPGCQSSAEHRIGMTPTGGPAARDDQRSPAVLLKRRSLLGVALPQASVSDALGATPRVLSLTTTAGLATLPTAVSSACAPVDNPVERLCRETASGLAVLDRARLAAELKPFSQPVAVLYVSYVTPTPGPSAFDTGRSSLGSLEGQTSPPPPNGTLAVRRNSHDGSVCLVFSTEQGSTALGCVLTNAAAVSALQLRDEQDMLNFLARSFAKDPSLKVLFQDIVKRLLQGQLHTVNHFVPGDFGRNRYFLSMRISPFAYRCDEQQTVTANPGLESSSRNIRMSQGSIAQPLHGPCEGACGGIMPAMILELDVPYEGKELAARLQRDYMIISNIPSIVTMFDMAGRVLHQNRSSVAYMGYLVGLDPVPGSIPASTKALHSKGVLGSPAAEAILASDQRMAEQPGKEGIVGVTTSMAAAVSAPSSPNRLRQLFGHEPEKLLEIVHAVSQGMEWRGLIKMPSKVHWNLLADEPPGDRAPATEQDEGHPAGASVKPSSSSSPDPSLAAGCGDAAAVAAAAASRTSHQATFHSTKLSPTFGGDATAAPGQRRVAADLLRELQATVMSGNVAKSRSLHRLPPAPQSLDENAMQAPQVPAARRVTAEERSRLSTPGAAGLGAAPRPQPLSLPSGGSALAAAARSMLPRGLPQSAPITLAAVLPQAMYDAEVPYYDFESHPAVAPAAAANSAAGPADVSPADGACVDHAGGWDAGGCSGCGYAYTADDDDAGAEVVALGPRQQGSLTNVWEGSPTVMHQLQDSLTHARADSASTAAASGATFAQITLMERPAVANCGVSSTSSSTTTATAISGDHTTQRHAIGPTGRRVERPAGALLEVSIGSAADQTASSGEGPRSPSTGEPGDRGKGSVCSVPIPTVQTRGSGGRCSPQLLVPVLSAPLCPAGTASLLAWGASAQDRTSSLPVAAVDEGAAEGSGRSTKAAAMTAAATAGYGGTEGDGEGAEDNSAVPQGLQPLPLPHSPVTAAATAYTDSDAAVNLMQTISAAVVIGDGDSVDGCSGDSSRVAEDAGVPGSCFTGIGEGPQADAAIPSGTGAKSPRPPHGSAGNAAGACAPAAAAPAGAPVVVAAWAKDGTSGFKLQSGSNDSAPTQLPSLTASGTGTASGSTAGRGVEGLGGAGARSPRSVGGALQQVVAARDSGCPSLPHNGSKDDLLLDGQGSLADEGGALLMSTDHNFSIEFIPQHLRPASVLNARNSSNLSRGNTAGGFGCAPASARPLAYIDEEKADEEGVQELSFLLPKMASHTSNMMGPLSAPPPGAGDMLPPHMQPHFVSMPPVHKLPDSVPTDSAAGTTTTGSQAVHTRDLLIPAPGGVTAATLLLARTSPHQPPPAVARSASLPHVAPPVSIPRQGPAGSRLSASALDDPNTAGLKPLASAVALAGAVPIRADRGARSCTATGPGIASAATDCYSASGALHGLGGVISNPAGTARGVVRGVTSMPSSRTTTYLQHTGLEQGRRLRAVLKALASNGGAGSSISTACSEALMRQSHSVVGLANASSMLVSKLPSGTVSYPAAAESPEAALVAVTVATPPSAPSAKLPPQVVLGSAVRGVRSDEDRWHEVHVKPCFDPMSSEPLVMVIQTDVTSKVRAEELLARVLEAEHRLLADIFPRHVVHYMTQRRKDEAELERNGLMLLRHIQDPAAVATLHESVSVLFADIKGFTEMSKEVPPAVVMTFLNDLYTRFDSLTDVYGVYKVETIGDCYMVAGGLMARDVDGYGRAVRGQGDTDPLHAMRVVAFARAMLEEAAKVQLPNTGEPVQVRVGIHSGPVMSGVVGQKMPRFCLFGDTINTASRMESTGRPGAIHASCCTRQLLPPEEDEEVWAPTGGVEVKGKGRMDTYVWSPESAAAGRQRRNKQQRAMLLGTLSTLRSPSALPSPPSSLPGRSTCGPQLASIAQISSRHSAGSFDATTTIH